MNVHPQINRFGEQAILLQWDFKITPENLFWLLGIKEFIAVELFKSKVYIINTYNSLLINYDESIEYIYDDLLSLERIDFQNIKPSIYTSKLYKIPVCYDLDFGLDLEELALEKKRSVSEIIYLHTAPVYTLYFMGFLPGFLYLGGMDESLKMSRKKEPRKSVLKGAVGIAENQTGIYPKSSPAGWQIIGNSPINLFDLNSEKPNIFNAGDRIQFYEISKEEHAVIREKSIQNKFNLRAETNV